MAALSGQLQQAALSGNVNPRMSLGLNMLGFDWWPAHDTMASAGPCGALVSALPVSVTARALSGQIAGTFSDDWYHRIHVFPHVLNLGNLISSQVQEAYVWNAWLVSRTLLAIDGPEEGITIDGPDDFPVVFGPWQISAYDIGIDRQGPSTIDVVLTWSFDGIPGGALPITGQRIVAWALTPDWSSGVRERLQFVTDVMTSPADVEQRRGMRLAPRRVFQANLLAQGRERTLMDLMLHDGGGKVWGLPIWPDIQLLSAPIATGAVSIACATAGRDFRAGGLLLLRGDSAFTTEVAEIDTVGPAALALARPTQQAWPVGTRLYPVRTARLLAPPSVRRITDMASRLDVEFVTVEPCDWPALALPTYRGFPVFDARPEESEELTTAYDRALAMLDSATNEPFVLDTAEAAITRQMHRWKLSGIAAHTAFRSLLYTLDGRRVAMWVPTHAWDLTVVAAIGSASTAVQIENVGYAQFGVGQRGRQDIRIELRSGTVYYRRIVGAVQLTGSTEQLAIDTALGTTVQPQAIARVSFMTLSRSDSDEFEIQHINDVAGVATSAVIFRSVGDEL